MKTLFVCLLLALAISSVSSACSMGKLSIQKHKWTKRMTPYCEYNGMKLSVGSRFTDYNTCMECSCAPRGLQCCGIGYSAGKFHFAGCATVPDFCQVAVLNKAKTALCHP